MGFTPSFIASRPAQRPPRKLLKSIHGFTSMNTTRMPVVRESYESVDESADGTITHILLSHRPKSHHVSPLHHCSPRRHRKADHRRNQRRQEIGSDQNVHLLRPGSDQGRHRRQRPWAQSSGHAQSRAPQRRRGECRDAQGARESRHRGQGQQPRVRHHARKVAWSSTTKPPS